MDFVGWILAGFLKVLNWIDVLLAWIRDFFGSWMNGGGVTYACIMAIKVVMKSKEEKIYIRPSDLLKEHIPTKHSFSKWRGGSSVEK